MKKRFGLALALAASAWVAQAATYPFSMPLSPQLPFQASVPVTGTGPFTDLWTFTAPAGSGSATGSAISVDISPWYNIDNMLIALYQGNAGTGTLVVTGSGNPGSTLQDVLVVANDHYYFQVTGTVADAPNGYYSFLAIAAPVPEPETYVMWLAGLAVIGFVAARRRAAR